MAGAYEDIRPGGGSTGRGLSLQRRLALIEEHVDLTDRVILDAGCADGHYVEAFLERSPHVTGVEFNERAVARYRERTGDDRVRVGDIADLDHPSAHFDFILLNEVLEHVPDEVATLRELHRVLAPGGTLALLSPNRLYPFEQHGAHTRGGRPIPHYVPFVPYVPLSLGRRVMRYHARNFWPSELRRLAEDVGFEVVDHRFLWQTFEGLSSDTPGWLRRVGPVLRRVSFAMERIPGIRRFGLSQVLICRRPRAAGDR